MVGGRHGFTGLFHEWILSENGRLRPGISSASQGRYEMAGQVDNLRFEFSLTISSKRFSNCSWNVHGLRMLRPQKNVKKHQQPILVLIMCFMHFQ